MKFFKNLFGISSEEDEDHQHHDDEGDVDRLLERVDRIDDEGRGVDQVVELDVRG